MAQIRLTATGQGGKKRTALLSPSSIEELKEAIIDIAYGFHCDYDKVTADIVDGNGKVIIQHCDMCESDNLLFVGYNCDDGRYYDASLEEYFDGYNEALKANTREDYDGDIKAVLQYFQKMAIRTYMKETEAVERIEHYIASGDTVVCTDRGNGSAGIDSISDLSDYEDWYCSFVSVAEFEKEFGESVEEHFNVFRSFLDFSAIEGFVLFEDPDNIESNPWRLYVAVYNY